MRSFVSEGAAVLTGTRNGVAKLLKDESFDFILSLLST